MLEVRKSKELGFCTGVKKAIEMVEKLSAGAEEAVWTIGPLVHNPGVIAALDKKGIKDLKSIGDLKPPSAIASQPESEKGQVVIPTHGMGIKEKEALINKGLPLHDSTCPIVGNLQKKVRKLSKEGYGIILFGEAEHPEVKGALGWVEEENNPAIAAKDLSEVKRLVSKARRIAVLSQTTQTISGYNQFCQEILKNYLASMLEIKILNTICPEVRRRQKATRELALSSDLMIIVGGKGSSNTRRLAEICQEAGAEAYQVEEAEEIKAEWLKDKRCIGIAAGTSTPIESVEAAERKVKKLTQTQ